MQIIREYSYKTKASSPSGDFLIWIASLNTTNNIAIVNCEIDIENGLGKVTSALTEFLKNNTCTQGLIDSESNIIRKNFIISSDQILAIASLINSIPKKFKYRDVVIKIFAKWENSESNYDIIFELKNVLRAIGREVSQSCKVPLPMTALKPTIPIKLHELLTSFKKCYPLQWIPSKPIPRDIINETSSRIDANLSELTSIPTGISLLSLEEAINEMAAVEFSQLFRTTFQKHDFVKSRQSYGMGISGYETFTTNGNRILIECIYSHLYKSIQFPIVWDVYGGKGFSTLYLFPYTNKIRHPYPFGNMDQVNTIASLLDARLDSVKRIISSALDPQYGETQKWYFE